MRIVILLTIALLTFSCSKKDKSNISSIKSLQKPAHTNEKKTTVLDEKVHFIGFVNTFYFSKKNEVYIELSFKSDKINDQEYYDIVKLADSLIYQDDETSRHRFPAGLASKYFDLRGLSKLAIYDENNKFICNGDFVRTEYLNEPIASHFIAVYKTDKRIKSNQNYAISNFDKTTETPNYTIIRDTVLTQKLLTKLGVTKSYFGLEKSGTHLHFANNDTVISVINSESDSYVVSFKGEELKILYKSAEPENITDLKIIPLMKNKLPYLLTRCAKPETDVEWEDLLSFDGTKYSSTSRQKIE
ncbi:hypothetical protein [Flavobacterium mesophilum]|uniref:hypothetical protein n=1 Tax=Flavobacterium mesophilum TaxID=3143495 RepID=UPI0031D510A2